MTNHDKDITQDYDDDKYDAEEHIYDHDNDDTRFIEITKKYLF